MQKTKSNKERKKGSSMKVSRTCLIPAALLAPAIIESSANDCDLYDGDKFELDEETCHAAWSVLPETSTTMGYYEGTQQLFLGKFSAYVSCSGNSNQVQSEDPEWTDYKYEWYTWGTMGLGQKANSTVYDFSTQQIIPVAFAECYGEAF